MQKFRLRTDLSFEVTTFFSLGFPDDQPRQYEPTKPVYITYRAGSYMCLWPCRLGSYRSDTFWVDLCGCPYSQAEIIWHIKQKRLAIVSEIPKLPRS